MNKATLAMHGIKKKNIIHRSLFCKHSRKKRIPKNDFTNQIVTKVVVCKDCGSVRSGYSYEMGGVRD